MYVSTGLECCRKLRVSLRQGIVNLPQKTHMEMPFFINPLSAELNPVCHLLALLGGATIVVVSRLRVKG